MGEEIVTYDYHTIVNVLVLTLMAIGGWFFRQVWEIVKEMRKDIKTLEVTIPTTYVNKADHQLITQRQDEARQKAHDEVMAKLDSIGATIDNKFTRVYDKLEGKVDK